MTAKSVFSRLLNSKSGQLLKEPARQVIEAVGYDIVPLHRHDTARLRNLLQRHQIAMVVDVGANQGQYARRMRVLGFRGRILSIEPGADAFSLLSRHAATDPLWAVERLAIGAESGVAQLHVAANSVSSSLLGIRQTHLDAAPDAAPRTAEPVVVKRLDDVVDAGQTRLWLKIDTQGFELQVLRGARQTLAHTQVLQAELSLASLYEGQANFLEVLQHLEDAGFSVVDLVPGFRDQDTGRLLQCDVIAARPPDAPAEGPASPSPH